MKQKRNDNVSVIVYLETGSEFLTKTRSHKRNEDGKATYCFAVFRSCFFGADSDIKIHELPAEDAIAAAMTECSKQRRSYLIVDDGRLFLCDGYLARFIRRGEWQVSRHKVRYKLQDDADKLPDMATGLYISDRFFSLSLQHAGLPRRCDILQYGNFGINVLSDMLDYTSNCEVIDFINNPAKYTLSDAMKNKLSLYISYHQSYIQCTYRLGKARPQRSLVQTASVFFMKTAERHITQPHCDELATYCERQATAGPMIRQLQSGRYDGYCYILDVSSMYPSIGMLEKFPASLIGIDAYPSDDTVNKALYHGMVIAKCNIKCSNQAVPKILDGAMSWPVGQYDTWLPDPEFRKAWRDGLVECVYQMVRYCGGYVLKNYCEEMIQIRNEYAKSGKKIHENIIKQITNTLFGALSGRITVWMPEPNYGPAPSWKIWQAMRQSGARKEQYRSINGMVERLIGRVEKDGTMPAVFATMTSYARLMMRNYIEIACPENVFAVSTDSIICNIEGMKRLESYISFGERKPGALRIAKRGTHCLIYSARQHDLMPPGDAYVDSSSVFAPVSRVFDAMQFAMVTDTVGILGRKDVIYTQRSQVKTISDYGDVDKPMSPVMPIHECKLPDYQDNLPTE